MKKALFIVSILFLADLSHAQDSVSGINPKTSVSKLYKMLQGIWEHRDSGFTYQVTFHGTKDRAVYHSKKDFDSARDTYSGNFSIMYVDRAKYVDSQKYWSKINDACNCDIDMNYTNGFYIFGVGATEGIFAISKNYLWLKSDGPPQKGKKLYVMKKVSK